MVSHQIGLSSGWSLIRIVFHHGGVSSSNQDGLSSGWSLIRVVFRQVGLIRMVSHEDGFSSVWSLIRAISCQGFHCSAVSVGCR